MNRTTTQEVNVSTETRSPNAEASDAADAVANQAAKYPFRVERDEFDWNVIANGTGEYARTGLTEDAASSECRRLNKEACR